jgi:ABC-type transport system involved in multi-copper enzyme maturation permease subunit
MSDPRKQVSASPAWWIVCRRETRDLWVGGKALYLILIYSLLLGGYSYLLASNAEVSLLPLREMIQEMVRHAISVAAFISLIIAADSFSGDRERATLETLLLTPASRGQIAAGKFLAAFSAWPVAFAIAVPYLVVLSKGDPVLGQGLLWGGVLGTVLTLALTGLGLLVSMWCNSNKTSMMVGLCLYLMLLLPTELSRPRIHQTVIEVRRTLLYSFVNPWEAAAQFLGKVLGSGRPPAEVWYLPVLTVAFATIVLVLLFAVAARRLRLDAGTALWWKRRVAAVVPASRPAPRVRAAAARPEAPLPVIPQPARIPHRPRPLSPGGGAHTWWVVLKKELGDLWIGGRALQLTVAYTVVLGIYTYITARDSALSLIPPKEMVFELTKAAMVASVFVSLIIGADSLSGERERATLEGLLLTPISRRQIIVGKFLAAASPGPAALAITIPYMKVLSQGDEVFRQAVLWGGGLGAVLTLAFTAMAMFVGFWCNSNKTSLFVSLCLYLLLFLPTQLTGHAQGGSMGLLFQWINPLAAPKFFLAATLVNNWTMARAWSWILSPIAFAALTFGLLFWYAGPALRLEAGRAHRVLGAGARAAAALLLLSLLSFASPAAALSQEPAPAVQATEAQLQVSIDVTAKTVRAGTPLLYNTVVTNPGMTASPPLIVAMNIINLNAAGDVVDPEDWSPQRTQYSDPIAAGQSVTLNWRINAILDGDYMVYMVVIPAPSGAEATSHPVTSPGIHLIVTKFTRLNPGGVLPYAIGGPVLLGLIIFFVYRQRHRQIDAGGGA